MHRISDADTNDDSIEHPTPPRPQNASVALQSQEYKLTSPSAGSPLPISGSDPVATAAAISAAAAAAASAAAAAVAAGGVGLQHSSSTATAVGGGQPLGGSNTVLRVIVESLMYPVSLDILHQIFQRFGKVLKIVTFTKNNSFQVQSCTVRVQSMRFDLAF